MHERACTAQAGMIGGMVTGRPHSEDVVDLYMIGLFDEGRTQFAQHLPVEAGLAAVVGPSARPSLDATD